MKTFIATVLGIVTCTFAAQPYVGASIGYAAGLPVTALGYDYTASTTGASRTGIYGSPGGSAIVPALRGGFLSESGVGAELGVEYLVGLEQSFGSFKYTTMTETFKGTTSGIFITPALVVISKGKVSPYARVGLVFGVGMNYKNTTQITHSNTASGDTSYSTTYSGGVAFGFAGAAGAELALSPTAGLFAELDARSVTWGPGQVKSDSTYNYKSSYSNTDSQTRLQTYLPMQSLILKLGLNLYL